MKTNDQFLIEIFVLEYLEQFNCVQTTVKLACEQIGFDLSKDKIANKLSTHKSYV